MGGAKERWLGHFVGRGEVGRWGEAGADPGLLALRAWRLSSALAPVPVWNLAS